MAELFGKDTGCSRGRGGSMHLFDVDRHFMGGYAIIGGQIPLATGAAVELARSHVTVNAICPGFIETEIYAIIPEKVKEAILQRIPLGRVGTPQEVAHAVRYLIVDGEYITDQTLNINGGIYM